MLLNSSIKRCVIFFSPSSQWMEEKDWVLMALCKKLFSGVLEEENVSIVKWISHLEGIDNISILCFHLVMNLLRVKSILIKIVIEFNFLNKSGLRS